MITGKKILYIGNKYHNYYKNIIETLQKAGADVDFFPNKPALNITYIKKINKKYYNYYLNKYFKYIIKTTKCKDYDYVLFMNGEDIHEILLKDLKKIHKNAYFIMYQWDSVIVNKFQNYVHLLDSIFSFDRKDCETYGFNYLPLFYLDDFLSVPESKCDIDLLFIGTEHTNRLDICNSINKIVNGYGLKFFNYLYIPFFVWLKKLLVDKNYSIMDIKYLHFKKLDIKDVIEYFKRSRVILDIHSEIQSGLTMRTMEAIGARKKIITTNPYIKYEMFYDPNVILVIDKYNINIDRDFILNNYSYPGSLIKIIKKYSLSNWIKQLFIG